MRGTESHLRNVVEAIRSRDRALGEELQDLRGKAAIRDAAATLHLRHESLAAGGEVLPARLLLETIVLRTGRPVLAVAHDEPQLDFQEADSAIWRERLVAARPRLTPAIRAVGRIEVEHHPRLAWIGTGWLLRPEVIVTNRHVAVEFCRRSRDDLVFRTGTGGRPIDPAIDFLEAQPNDGSGTFRLRQILAVEDDDGPDLAFLRVDGTDLAEPIALSASAPAADRMVAVIGYPARDSRLPDQQLMDQVFAHAYDAKRLAPGQIVRAGDSTFEHDCSTLGGNSGSVVLDLATGEALGIHFAGRFLEANFGVSSPLIKERLARALGSRPRRTNTPMPAAVAPPAGPTQSVRCDSGEAEDEVLEGAPAQYIGRCGFQSTFLGAGRAVPLPVVVRDADQVVEMQVDGRRERELRYQHFSVVMNRRRRMCFFSAVNVDGRQAQRAPRSAWRTDPRIGKELQILHECYGNSPKFSRGHMTRREDPIWGSAAAAAMGSDDSMHVTNTVPQMQAFNAPIWLGLETYALGNARRDAMRISVITGPVLLASDPLRFGIQIPLAFWKVIAFVHDETGELCVTGYSISQLASLPDEEHVFGAYETYQRSLDWIERQAGLSFGALAAADPLQDVEESLPSPLADFEQIRYLARRLRLE